MKVKELIAELKCYEEDADVVFEIEDDIEVDSWTEDRWGNKKVSVDKELEITFSCEIHGDCRIEFGVKREGK